MHISYAFNNCSGITVAHFRPIYSLCQHTVTRIVHVHNVFQLNASLSLRKNDMQAHLQMNPYNYEISQSRNFAIV